MGTNYYLHRSRKKPLHIGKSSGGWVFALRVARVGERGDYPAGLDGWRRLWNTKGSRIVDEYQRPVTPAEMEKIITERSWSGRGSLHRTSVGTDGCVGQGDGTWDMFDCDFD